METAAEAFWAVMQWCCIVPAAFTRPGLQRELGEWLCSSQGNALPPGSGWAPRRVPGSELLVKAWIYLFLIPDFPVCVQQVQQALLFTRKLLQGTGGVVQPALAAAPPKSPPACVLGGTREVTLGFWRCPD